MLSSLKRDTVALQRLDLKDGRLIKTLAASDACDVGGVSIDEKTKQPRAVAFTLARTERTFFDRVFAADYAWLEAAAGGAEVRACLVRRRERRRRAARRGAFDGGRGGGGRRGEELLSFDGGRGGGGRRGGALLSFDGGSLRGGATTSSSGTIITSSQLRE